MQYGVFSDIHGDLKALIAVWKAFEKWGLTEGGRPVFNAGDNVGYGPAPEECVQFLRARPNVVCVRGNYDKNVALFPEREEEYRKRWGQPRPDKLAAIGHDSETISAEARQWLLDLPGEVEVTLEGVPLLMTHYSPSSKHGLGRWTPDAQLREIAGHTRAKVVLCGHTHSAFVRSVGGVLWVNPGSAGRALDRRPHCAILTLEPGHAPAARLKTAL